MRPNNASLLSAPAPGNSSTANTTGIADELQSEFAVFLAATSTAIGNLPTKPDGHRIYPKFNKKKKDNLSRSGTSSSNQTALHNTLNDQRNASEAEPIVPQEGEISSSRWTRDTSFRWLNIAQADIGTSSQTPSRQIDRAVRQSTSAERNADETAVESLVTARNGQSTETSISSYTPQSYSIDGDENVTSLSDDPRQDHGVLGIAVHERSDVDERTSPSTSDDLPPLVITEAGHAGSKRKRASQSGEDREQRYPTVRFDVADLGVRSANSAAWILLLLDKQRSSKRKTKDFTAQTREHNRISTPSPFNSASQSPSSSEVLVSRDLAPTPDTSPPPLADDSPIPVKPRTGGKTFVASQDPATRSSLHAGRVDNWIDASVSAENRSFPPNVDNISVVETDVPQTQYFQGIALPPLDLPIEEKPEAPTGPVPSREPLSVDPPIWAQVCS